MKTKENKTKDSSIIASITFEIRSNRLHTEELAKEPEEVNPHITDDEWMGVYGSLSLDGYFGLPFRRRLLIGLHELELNPASYYEGNN